jgi:aspartate aminotransferase
VVYVSGFSKTWALTGLRLGIVVAREEIIRALDVFATNMYSCPPAPLQYAALKALEIRTGWFKSYLEEYRRRRDIAFEELNKVPGVRTIKSRGAFYLFPNVRELMGRARVGSVDELARRILFESGVVLLPGTAFPLRGGDGYLRVSYVLPAEKIREGFRRVREWAEKVGG